MWLPSRSTTLASIAGARPRRSGCVTSVRQRSTGLTNRHWIRRPCRYRVAGQSPASDSSAAPANSFCAAICLRALAALIVSSSGLSRGFQFSPRTRCSISSSASCEQPLAQKIDIFSCVRWRRENALSYEQHGQLPRHDRGYCFRPNLSARSSILTGPRPKTPQPGSLVILRCAGHQRAAPDDRPTHQFVTRIADAVVYLPERWPSPDRPQLVQGRFGIRNAELIKNYDSFRRGEATFATLPAGEHRKRSLEDVVNLSCVAHQLLQPYVICR